MFAHAARVGVKAIATAVDVVRRPPRGLVVLIYHRVGRRTAIEVDLPLDLFEEHIAWLASTLPVVSLADGLAWVEGNAAEPEESTRVAVTFDDGTADFVDLALPVLGRHRVPATLYVATAFIDEQRSFPNDGVPVSWQGLRDALTTGLVTIGSHTHTHALLDRTPAAQLAEELDRSRDLIGAQLGIAAEHFAYPKAVNGSPAARAAVAARFSSAALAGGRANRVAATDPFRLARTPVQCSDGRRWFRLKARGGLSAEDAVRRLVNRRRYSGATT